MSITIDLGRRYVAAFGAIGIYMSQELKQKGFKTATTNAQVYVRDTKKSFEEVKLTSSNGMVLHFGYSSISTEVEEFFAPPLMLSFSKSKRIERTNVDSTQGEVVELYGHRPWEISMEGLLIDVLNRNYPGQKIRKLNNAFDYDGTWAVEGKVFSDHLVKTIYFEEFTSSSVQGFEDTWKFSLKAYSHIPVEAILTQINKL